MEVRLRSETSIVVGNSTLKRANFLDHNGGIEFPLFDRLGFLTTWNASDEAINVPNELPNFFFRCLNFYLFFKAHAHSSAISFVFRIKSRANWQEQRRDTPQKNRAFKLSRRRVTGTERLVDSYTGNRIAYIF